MASSVMRMTGRSSATAAQLAAKAITLDAKNNIDLEADWNRQSALNHTTQKGLSVGVEASSGTTSVTRQNVGSVISSPAQAQMLKDYIFSAPVLSDFSIPLTKTDETGAIASPSWLDNVLMAKRPKLGKSGPGISSLSTSLTGGSGSGGQEPDDEESKQRKIREDSNKSPALRDSPYNPAAVSAWADKPPYVMNPAHNPRSSDFNLRKTPEPPDAEEVYYNNSIHVHVGVESSRTWYGAGEKGIYRFSDNNAGEMHFSGIIKDEHLIPVEVRRHFSGVMKGKIK